MGGPSIESNVTPEGKLSKLPPLTKIPGKPFDYTTKDGNSEIDIYGFDDGKIQIIKKDSQIVKTINTDTPDCIVCMEDIKLSPDGKTFISFDKYSGNIKLWSIDGTEIQTFKGHEFNPSNSPLRGDPLPIITDAEFSPDSKMISSSGLDGKILLWSKDSTEPKIIKSNLPPVESIQFSNEGNTLTSVNSDGSLINLADLEVKNIGKIECRPVLPDAEYLEIPTEVRSNRVAYVAVQFNQSLKEAKILGFTTQTLAKVPLSQLESVDNLLDYLTAKEQAAKVNISKWLEGVFTAGWLNLEEIFNPRELSFRFARNFSITQCKKVDLGLRLNGTSVVLIIKLNSKNKDITHVKNQNRGEIDIIVQVHPDTERSISLPPGLKLVVTDENGQKVDAVISRQNDNWVEIELSAELNEEFGVGIILGESKVTDNFIV